MLGVVFPFKAIKAVLERGDFKADTVREGLCVAVGARGDGECKHCSFAFRHIGGYIYRIGHGNDVASLGYWCVDCGGGNGDVL